MLECLEEAERFGCDKTKVKLERARLFAQKGRIREVLSTLAEVAKANGGALRKDGQGPSLPSDKIRSAVPFLASAAEGVVSANRQQRGRSFRPALDLRWHWHIWEDSPMKSFTIRRRRDGAATSFKPRWGR